MYRSAIVLLSSIAFAAPLDAQAPDTTVEVFGLKTWTVQMLQDSVQRYAPGTTLASAACAAILRDSVGFSQAAAEVMDFGSHVYIALSVVEPQDSSKLKPLVLSDSSALRKEWGGIISVLEKHPRAFGALQHFEFYSGTSNNIGGRPADSAAVALRDSVLAASERTALDVAVKAFISDRNRDNRVAAALVLGHLGERPAAWYALVRGLRGPSDYATTAGIMIIKSLARARPIRIDWHPAESDLKALLAGTNLFAYQSVLEVLCATAVDRELGKELAVHGKHLLLSNLQSKNSVRRSPALCFLKSISGREFDNMDEWAAWLRTP